MDSANHKHSNRLINESSPYLLQHAHNPVDWYPWGEEAFEKAKKENKLVIVSIGYSSCHWCHVMERESFENEEIAKQMNEHFVCIKVDREERPDVDQIYMSAVQLMTGQGGWPLNCITLPDKRPIYGGTYFPKDQWQQVLTQLSEFYKKDPAKANEYAEQLAHGIRNSETVTVKTTKPEFSKTDAKDAYESVKKNFDTVEGGSNRTPKFPMPNVSLFLMRYYFHTNDERCLNQIKLTLDKMAYGGIYDQLGGGFARYSTDGLWKAPHFEKMMYDNAQLVTLYSEGFQLIKNPLYKQVVYETLEFVAREMTSPEGGFFSALDADSEGEEGKYYVWQKPELEKILGKDFPLFAEYYNVNSVGLWEHGNYILLRKKSDEDLAKANKISVEELQKKISVSKKILLTERQKRIRPLLDDKQLASWNGLMLKGYATAYSSFNEKKFLDAAIKNANFILTKMSKPDGSLFHTYKNGKATINGYMEDYALVVEGLISLYQCTFDEHWLNEAKRLSDYAISHFHDNNSAMFYFTSNTDTVLITRKTDLQDDVIPASNSVMARNLFLLSHYFENTEYEKISSQMLHNMNEQVKTSAPWYSNWSIALLEKVYPFYELAMTGSDALKFREELNSKYIPNKLLCGAVSENKKQVLPLLESRFVNGKSFIYVCENKVCKLPVSSTTEAFKLIK